MRVADYIVALLADAGIDHAFMVTGGGAMHLNDALGREPRMELVFCHHEQTCSMAAESFARVSNRPALVNVTSGPGGINALNGVFGAYVDSIPMIIVSGQVKRETLISSYELPLRQLGDQEVDIVSMARPVCKMATLLSDPDQTRQTIEKAVWIATHGRPGPVWIDVPIDVQASPIEILQQHPFDASLDGEAVLPASEQALMDRTELRQTLQAALDHMARAKRPVVLAGAGVRLSGAHQRFLDAIEKLGVPVVTGWNAHDALWNSHPLYAGRPGTVGDRGGNFTVQNADFLLVLGSRLNIRQVSYNWENFARAAYIVMVDADLAELSKPTLSIDVPIHADLAVALEVLSGLAFTPSPDHAQYLAWCKERLARYPVVLDRHGESEKSVNPYVFIQALFDQLVEGDIVVTGDGTACVITFQAAALKRDQRLFTNSGCASMGYDLPAAIGAIHATRGGRVICLAGDGSLMLNLQELQTLVGQDSNVKMFILNNDGYSSIRQTQQNYFPDNIVGCGPESGLTFPDFTKIGEAFGIPVSTCDNHLDLKSAIKDTLSHDGPRILQVMLDGEQPFEPKLASRQLPDGRMISSPLEDLAPFLSREELASNMLIPLIEE
jgi:acetolactate synthase I/II/III large subunit